MADNKLIPSIRDSDGCICQATEDLTNVTDGISGISIDNIFMTTNCNQVTVDTPQTQCPPARYPEYVEEFARKQTFTSPIEIKSWPHQPEVQDIDNLARHGLFYTGIADLARCYQCGLGLKDWSREDDALFVHLKYSPTCHHIKSNTDPNLLRIYQKHIESSDGSNNGPPINRSDNPIRHPEYQSKQVRLASFIRWSNERTQTPEMLATAGFFHLGTSDIVRCFACDGGLHNWDSGDEPWIEHARWFPSCSHVLQEKGEEFVNMVRIASEAQYQAELEDGTNAAVVYLLYSKAAKYVIALGYSKKAVTIAKDECKSKELSFTVVIVTLDWNSPRQEKPELPQPNEMSNEQLIEENKYHTGRVMCTVCKIRERNTVFLPCGHLLMCNECSDTIIRCPICSTAIIQKLKILSD